MNTDNVLSRELEALRDSAHKLEELTRVLRDRLATVCLPEYPAQASEAVEKEQRDAMSPFAETIMDNRHLMNRGARTIEDILDRLQC